MSNQVHIPTPLRPYAGGAERVAVEAGTVAEALAQLTATHPALRQHLFARDGKLRSFVNVNVNDADIRYLDGGATAVKPGDVLISVPSIAGEAAKPKRADE